MTPMAALVFTATFALIIWIPTFAITARVYPPNEGKDLPMERNLFKFLSFEVTTWDGVEWPMLYFLLPSVFPWDFTKST